MNPIYPLNELYKSGSVLEQKKDIINISRKINDFDPESGRVIKKISSRSETKY